MKTKLAMALVGAAALTGCGTDLQEQPSVDKSEAALTRGFTPDDVTAIVSQLRPYDPKTYRIVLPTFKGTTIIGQTTYGALPVSRVTEIATRLSVQVQSNANVVTALDARITGGDGGGAGGGQGGGGDQGSMTPASAQGQELTRKIDQVLANVNAKEYQFLR